MRQSVCTQLKGRHHLPDYFLPTFFSLVSQTKTLFEASFSNLAGNHWLILLFAILYYCVVIDNGRVVNGENDGNAGVTGERERGVKWR